MYMLIEKIQKAIQIEACDNQLDGWLFTDFGGKDKLTTQLLQIPKDKVSSRRWIYIVQDDKTKPIKILHLIEQDILSHLPGSEIYTYSSQDELKSILNKFQGKTLALLSDKNLPVISTVDGGFVDILRDLGINTVTAAPLMQRCLGTLTNKGIESHERAATLLYKIVDDTWNFICHHYNQNLPLTEGMVVEKILMCFLNYNLVTDHAPIVAFGKNTANPHYQVPTEGGKTAEKGDVIQLDIWAKEKFALDEEQKTSSTASVYADISWVGIYGSPTPEQTNVFNAICQGRDTAVNLIKEACTLQQPISGNKVDIKVRQKIRECGYHDYLMHRTGHGIDTNCHGSGVNLDGIEFPDERKIIPGSCFSIEPGIYKKDFGMRTEINMYLTTEGNPIISGLRFQKRLKNIDEIPQKKLLVTETSHEHNN